MGAGGGAFVRGDRVSAHALMLVPKSNCVRPTVDRVLSRGFYLKDQI
jgi:hypothetical protein